MIRWLRYWAPRVCFVVVVVGQLYLLVAGYGDPHKHFAFQPFNEADRFQFEVFRVDRDGRRHSVSKPWAGYTWASLVRVPGLSTRGRWGPATSGIESTLAFLHEAMAWVASHTPKDASTVRYEAKVSYFHNQRGPFDRTLTETRTIDGAQPKRGGNAR